MFDKNALLFLRFSKCVMPLLTLQSYSVVARKCCIETHVLAPHPHTTLAPTFAVAFVLILIFGAYFFFLICRGK